MRDQQQSNAGLTRLMYPSSGCILIFQRSSESEGKCATALFALWAAASRGSNPLDILEPSVAASGVISKIANLLSMRGITLCRRKLTITAGAFLAKRCSTSVSTLSLAWRSWGTPHFHVFGFS